jgi:2',3'-cyclic-nucleotide 2'-phosphodiesterase / 3'-nucleotidase / 5'-nucleotidase
MLRTPTPPRDGALLVAALAFAWGCSSSPVRATPGALADPSVATDTASLVVAATTDVHGRLRGWDYFADAPDTLRGLSRAATIIDSVRAAHPGRVVLVDAGDLLQGNPLTYVAARVDSSPPHPVIAAMNAMRYDAAALGNHEFNYGVPFLTRALEQSRFPFLSANTYRANGTRAYGGSHVVERGGVRVGIVGATTPGVMVWDRDHVAGRLVLRDIVPEVAREVREVRRRADVVVVVMHTGLGEPASYDTVTTGLPSENVAARVAREVPGIDLVVIGHSHREVADTVINGVTIIQPRNWATSVATASLSLSRRGGRWQVDRTRGVIVRAAGHAEHPAVLAATQQAHAATLRWVNQALGTTPVAWRADSARVADVPLIDFMLEVQRAAAGTQLAATAAFDIGATLGPGPITVAKVARLYPYDNTLRAVRITGRQLRDFLEFSARYYRTAGTPEAAESPTDPRVPGYNFDIIAGADYTIDISRPVGQRVTRLQVNGRDVTDGDSYTLALNNYRQTGGGGYAMLRDAPLIYDRQEEIRDLLIAEVRRRGVLRPEDYSRRNWRLEPPAAAASAYRAMSGSAFDASGTVRGAANRLARGRWLRIISTNDFHGAFEARTDNGGVVRGGAAQLASAIASARAECPAPTCSAVWLDGGDQFQGTPASNMTHGRSVVELFGRLGLSAAALGNHEFDWGLDTLRARMRQAPYAFLAANVRDTLGRDIPWIPNDTLIRLPGVTVGVIGVATVETPTSTRPTNVAAMRFLPAAPIVDAHARALRARGADAVVVVAHAGAFCDRADTNRCNGEIIDLAQQVTERIDAIVSGHTHSPVAAVIRGVPVVQAFSRASAIGVIDLPLHPGEEATVHVRNVRPDSVPADSAVAAYTEQVLAQTREAFGVVVGTIAERMTPGTQSALGNLIADAQRAAGKGDIAVMNRGGVRAPLAAGPATYGALFEVAPFGNALVRVRARGADLRRWLEKFVSGEEPGYFNVSGVRIHYDPARPAGQRITRLQFADGRPFSARRIYRIVLSDFLAVGGNGLFVPDHHLGIEDLKIADVDALALYVRSQPQPVRAPTDVRLVPSTTR